MLLARAHHDDWHRGRGRASFVLYCDGEGFGLGTGRQRRIDDRCAAVGIGLEHARGDGRALRRNQPQLIGLLRRQAGMLLATKTRLLRFLR